MSKCYLAPISTAPKDDTMIIGFRNYGDNTFDFWICMRSTHGAYYVAAPDARIVNPSHWAPLPKVKKSSTSPTYPVGFAVAEECLGTYKRLRKSFDEVEAMRVAMEHALEGWAPP